MAGRRSAAGAMHERFSLGDLSPVIHFFYHELIFAPWSGQIALVSAKPLTDSNPVLAFPLGGVFFRLHVFRETIAHFTSGPTIFVGDQRQRLIESEKNQADRNNCCSKRMAGAL